MEAVNEDLEICCVGKIRLERQGRFVWSEKRIIFTCESVVNLRNYQKEQRHWEGFDWEPYVYP